MDGRENENIVMHPPAGLEVLFVNPENFCMFKYMYLPLGFIRKAGIIRLSFIIINSLFPLGFIK